MVKKAHRLEEMFCFVFLADTSIVIDQPTFSINYWSKRNVMELNQQ